ncbi:MAG: hypothetical protein LBK06_02030 [Planctomycetaceae bacterium]|jgi:hypothetical protein|nr:hypothetical protein [Planctomycetaceae bacterium]
MKKTVVILILLCVCVVLLFNGCNRTDNSVVPHNGDPKNNTDNNGKNPETTAATSSVVVTNAASGDGVDKEKYIFRYKFQKGDEFRWNVVQQLKIDTTIKGTNEIVETYSKSVKVWRVLENMADNVAKFEYWVEGVDMRKIQTGQELTEYNSTRDREIPKEFKSLEGTIGVPLAHFMIDMQGVIRRKIPLKIYSDESRENRIVIHLPDVSLSVGDSWTVDLPVVDVQINSNSDKVRKVSAKQRYKLESVQAGAAKIKFDTQVLTPLEPQMQAKVLDLYMSGELMFDIDAGKIISQKITVDKTVIGFVERNDSLHHVSRLTECSCGLRSCEICAENKK